MQATRWLISAGVALVLVASPALASDDQGSTERRLGVFSDDGVLVAISADGAFKWWLDGRIFVDAAAYSEGANALASGVEIRKARLGIKSRLHGDWESELELGFADNELDVKDMYIAYVGLRRTEIKVGQHREPFSLEEVISSQYQTLMERSLVNVFAPGRSVGLSLATWGASWRVQAGVFGQEVGDGDRPENNGEDEGLGLDARLSWAPLHAEGRVLHLGVAASRRTPNAGSGDSVRFAITPETYVSQAELLDTGTIDRVDVVDRIGLEVATVAGPFSIQAEYVQTEVRREAAAVDASFDGWYAFASLVLTGQPRRYAVDEAELESPEAHPGDHALELAVRYSTVDLDDLAAGVAGGTSESITVGLNYYLSRNLRLMLDYGRSSNGTHADGNGTLVGDDDFDFVQSRIQLMF